MVDNNTILHQGDDIVLTDHFNFSDAMFDLLEPVIPQLSGNFSTPASIISQKLQNLEKLLKLGHINACSTPKHIHEIDRVVTGAGFDALAVSETFISPSTPKSIYQIPGYNYFNKSRDQKCRGGVGIYVNENFPAKIIKLPVEFVQPEMLFIEITVGMVKFAMGVVYKSPLIPYSVFAAIHENIAAVSSKYEHFVIMGDFNINHLQPESSSCRFFTNYVTEPFALTQVVSEPTRITAGTSTLIDLMLTSNPENVKAHGVVDTPGISDHCMVFMAYSLKKPKFKAKMVTRRDFRNFDKNAYLHDMSLAPWGNIEAVEDNDIDNKVTIFENIHKEIIDKHAPFRTFRVTRPAAPWLTEEIKDLMDERDKYKNKFNLDKCSQTEILFKDLRNKVSHAVRQAKIKTFNNKINTKIKDPKVFHKALKTFSVVETSINSQS